MAEEEDEEDGGDVARMSPAVGVNRTRKTLRAGQGLHTDCGLDGSSATAAVLFPR